MDIDFIGRILLFVVAILPSAIVHEVAHGYAAFKFGDPTAKLAGRLTLNPLKHIDLFTTVLLPIGLSMANLPSLIMFKPVPINIQNFSNPRRDSRFVALAGPLSNVLLALIVIFLYRLLLIPYCPKQLYIFLAYFVLINLGLAAFNLIPIPPLDGSWILTSFLNGKVLENFIKFRTYFVIIFLFLVLSGLLGRFSSPVWNFLDKTAVYFLPIPMNLR